MKKRSIGFCYGSWGDVIIHLGYIQQMRKEAGPIIYYGDDPRIAMFVSNQSICTYVIHIRHSAHQKHHDFLNNSFYSEPLFRAALKAYASQYNFDPEDVLMSFPKSRAITDIDYKMPIAHDLRPSSIAIDWVDSLGISEPFILLQPFSINTNSLSQHWPYWYPFIRSLTKAYQGTKIVLVGTSWPIDKIDTDNTVNLVGKTIAVDHVYALADKSIGVISTGNSLAHYCVANRIPLMVCAGFHTGTKGRTFSRVLRSESTVYVGHTDSIHHAMFKLGEFTKIIKAV